MCGCWGCWFALLWFFVVGFCFRGNLSQSQLIPVVDRPCLALVRQCRKKKLREDELLPDLHITRDGVLRIGLGAHQEHRVNHEARAADRTKVSAEVIQLAAHEVDPSLTRLSRKVVPVTLKVVKVRVTRSRMTLLLRWRMQNSCKLRMLQWARTFMTKKISLGRSTANFRNWSWFLRDGCGEVIVFSTKMCGPP